MVFGKSTQPRPPLLFRSHPVKYFEYETVSRYVTSRLADVNDYLQVLLEASLETES